MTPALQAWNDAVQERLDSGCQPTDMADRFTPAQLRNFMRDYAAALPPAGTIALALQPREFDHILAGLRVYQQMLEMHSAVCQDVEEIATEHGPEMTPEEIDALCQRLNTGN